MSNQDASISGCDHGDPMVIDGRTAWCARCGALFGMGVWRLPESRAPWTLTTDIRGNSSVTIRVGDRVLHSCAHEARPSSLDGGVENG